MTKSLNAAYYGFLTLVGIIAVLPLDQMPDWVYNLVPPKARPWIVAVVSALMWLKSHRNLFVNPDGTPAKLPWLSTPDTTAMQQAARTVDAAGHGGTGPAA